MLPLAIVALAFVLRVVQLSTVPYGFFCDEATQGLDARAIAQTLRDTHGRLLPFYMEGLGQWRGGFHTYCQIPFVAAFGMSEFSVRLGSAFIGTLTVWLLYLYTRRAVNHSVGVLSAFLLATSPWHIMHSRVGWDVIGLPFVTLLCLIAFNKGLRNARWLPVAFACAALGMYTYFPSRVFFPLLGLAWLIIYGPRLLRTPRRRKMAAIGLGVALVLLIPVFLALRDGTMFARFNEFSGTPPTLAERFATFKTHYIAHFSPDFLFKSSDHWLLRHYVRGFGMLYWFQAPFLILGVLTMLGRRRRSDWLFLAWFLIYPVAGALVEPPVSTRAITGVLLFQIAAAQGIVSFAAWLQHILKRLPPLRVQRRLVTGAAYTLLIGIGLLSTSRFMRAYLVEYPQYSSGYYGWQWGARPIAEYFDAHRDEYDRLWFNADYNAPEELLKFFSTPALAQSGKTSVSNIADEAMVRGVYTPNQRQLWAVSADAWDKSVLRTYPFRIVHQIYYPDGSLAFNFVATGPVQDAQSTPGAPPLPPR